MMLDDVVGVGFATTSASRCGGKSIGEGGTSFFIKDDGMMIVL